MQEAPYLPSIGDIFAQLFGRRITFKDENNEEESRFILCKSGQKYFSTSQNYPSFGSKMIQSRKPQNVTQIWSHLWPVLKILA